MNFLLQLVIAVALMIVGYMLMPKPEVPPTQFKKGEKPESSAGKPVPRLFGTKTLKDPNCLWWGDKYFVKSKVDA